MANNRLRSGASMKSFALHSPVSPRNLLALVLLTAATAQVQPAPADKPLATVRLTSGWATFGLVFPQGTTRTSLQLGNLPTQTDVKTTWPDGSIRFAVVSANIPSAGDYAVHESAAKTGSFAPAVP